MAESILEYKSPEWLYEYAQDNGMIASLIEYIEKTPLYITVPVKGTVINHHGKTCFRTQFRYDDLIAEVSEELAAKIEKGEYIAIASCKTGEETMLRIHLTESKPEKEDLQTSCREMAIKHMFEDMRIDTLNKLITITEKYNDNHNVY